MYNRLLIPVDGSDEARRAARRGLELARAFDAAVDVLHVVEQEALWLTESDDESERLQERGRAVLEEIEALASEVAHPVSTTLVEGGPATEISEFATERGADLVVLGRQGLTGLGRRLLGGVTEQVLHRCTVPVFVVPGGADTADRRAGYDRVLVPTDGSENADAIAPHGAAIADRFGSTVHVLNVVDLQDAGGVFNAGGLESAFVERLEAAGREAVEQVADAVGETAPEVEVRTAVERTASHEGAAAGIRAYVEANDVDLVVIGSHGRSNLERHLLGSVASTVLRTVDVPVLVVKPEQ